MFYQPSHPQSAQSHQNIPDGLHVSLLDQDQPSLDVQLDCKRGEMLALVGPSGGGKSTILRSIAGLHNVKKGLIRCTGETWLDTSTKHNTAVQKRRIGMVFQHYALFPHKSVIDNVALGIRSNSKDQRRDHALSWLEKTNMTGLEHRLPKQLSGGQRQRVALARALAGEPSVLLLDEPFSAVDQQTRRKLYRELAQLRMDLDIPIILVTHDVNEVQQLADSLCLIHKGQSLQQGPVREVINSPSNKTVAKLLGHQNLFSATVKNSSDNFCTYKVGEQNCLQGKLTHLPVGSHVTLLILPSAISICTEGGGSDSQNASNNRLNGTIRDAVSLGDEWSITVHLNTITKSLRFRVPQHAYKAETLKPGNAISVNVRPSGISAIANYVL